MSEVRNGLYCVVPQVIGFENTAIVVVLELACLRPSLSGGGGGQMACLAAAVAAVVVAALLSLWLASMASAVSAVQQRPWQCS